MRATPMSQATRIPPIFPPDRRLSDDLRRRKRRFRHELSPTDSLVHSTYLGGTGNDRGNGIAVDSAGNAYATGYTFSTNFPTTTGTFQTTSGGGLDAFVTKLNPTGTALVYSTYLGGTGTEGHGIAVDTPATPM